MTAFFESSTQNCTQLIACSVCERVRKKGETTRLCQVNSDVAKNKVYFVESWPEIKSYYLVVS